MLIPQTPSEHALFSTVRIVASNGATGTGFFFEFELPDQGGKVPVIITNKHVVNNQTEEAIEFQLHEKVDGGPGNVPISIRLNSKWYFHPEYDICFMFAGPLFEHIRSSMKKEVYYCFLAEEFIQSDEKLADLTAVEDVVMVGYPKGLWDKANSLPLLRRGTTASHASIDFNNQSKGVLDMACFPGSSGSPIMIINEASYFDKLGVHVGAQRIILLGVLFAGPTLDAKGKITIKPIPTQNQIDVTTPVMIHLGYYVKAKELLAFRTIIQQQLVKPK